jgi:hypothetical protein
MCDSPVPSSFNHVFVTVLFPPATLSVTCSVGLGQDLDAPFPFSILDYGGRRHDYAVDPGQIVCFEGST